ncbi:nuclear transport factor 2 family protein [Neobacillus sp. D3-1R]|uniref:nuclear transport factor 2 family protein n=1 Tax=Neobacillus sp. D3-1R TaxID=3445778 RepID=UPI003FA0F4E9
MNERDNETLSLKEKAVSFLKLVASGEVREAYQKFIGPDFRHHNAYFKGDAHSLMIAMEENATQNPDKTFEIKRSIEDGEFVWVHSHVKQNQNDPGAALVHIFRFHNGLIVEAWDIGMAIPVNSPNENGIF